MIYPENASFYDPDDGYENESDVVLSLGVIVGI